ncbi:MAG: hypothetical protein IPG10_01170 [Flavobacteriales bacterium]|nr:hypothetical protein [Flavobacteriales bacterium]
MVSVAFVAQGLWSWAWDSLFRFAVMSIPYFVVFAVLMVTGMLWGLFSL